MGNGTTGERITTGNKTAFDIEPFPSKSPLLSIPPSSPRTVYVRELDGKNIVQIASGPQHSLAVDDTGYDPFFSHLQVFLNHALQSVVYVWGYNGYCRLGLGNQVDALKPKVVPQVCFVILSPKLSRTDFL